MMDFEQELRAAGKKKAEAEMQINRKTVEMLQTMRHRDFGEKQHIVDFVLSGVTDGWHAWSVSVGTSGIGITCRTYDDRGPAKQESLVILWEDMPDWSDIDLLGMSR